MLLAVVILLAAFLLVGSCIITISAWITSLLLGTIILLISKFYMDRRTRFSRFKDLGIPGPKPGFWFGNFREISNNGIQEMYLKWHKQYGKTFGYFEGTKPILVTSDTDMIQQVYVKNFSSFNSRKREPILPLMKKGLVRAEGDDWKRLRSIASPSFSAKRMKEMSPFIHRLVGSLMELFNEKAAKGESFDVMSEFQRLTISVIGTFGFGIDVDAIKDPNDVFLQKCRMLFNGVVRSSPAQAILTYGPILEPSLENVLRMIFYAMMTPSDEEKAFFWFVSQSHAIIKSRVESGLKRNDLIQLMLNANKIEERKDMSGLEISVEDDAKVTEEKGKQKSSEKTIYKMDKMTLEEMQAQCIVFLLAGYETTSTSLTCAVHELAVHPDVQQKLQKEIDENLPGDTMPDYITVQKMPYLDMFFSEVLRLHSLGMNATNRECMEDCTVQGLRLVRGDAVQIHKEAVHFDPELWGPEDPREFIPERFTAERKGKRHPMAWIPFGGGPRNCIGMRFALMEAKTCLAHMLKMFNIVRTEKTQVPIVKTKLAWVSKPKDGVWVKLEKRK